MGKSLEVSGNSSVTFISKPIPNGQQTSRHKVSFLFRDGTARGKTITVFRGPNTRSQGADTAARFRLEGDTITISGPNGQDEEQFSFRTNGVPALVTTTIDPRRGRIRVSWQTRTQTLTLSTEISEQDESRRSEQFIVDFRMDFARLPRGRMSIDNVRAIWSPRLSFGSG